MVNIKILALVDLHGSITTLRKIIRRAKKQDIDIIIDAGDNTIFGEKQYFILRELNKIKKPVLIIHGNHETERATKKLCKRLKNCIFLHNKIYRKNNCIFFGWGGGGFSLIDKELEKAEKRLKKQFNKKKKLIFVTHAPPYKTKLDMLLEGQHAGNKSIRRFITRQHPVLAVCGHFHENAGKTSKLSKTKIVNPGPKGKVLEI